MPCDLALGFSSPSGCDLLLTSGDLQGDSTLYTAVIVSLFTNAKAELYEELPSGETDRQGWWGDYLDDSETRGPTGAAGAKFIRRRKLGSRLWLLRREIQHQKIVARAEQYASEALQWLIDDQLVRAVQVEGGMVRNGILTLQISLDVPPASATRLPPAAYETKNWTLFYDYKNNLPVSG